MKIPKGAVKFGYGKFENLPVDAEEIKLYMRPGDPMIYIVPISDIPYAYDKWRYDEDTCIGYDKDNGMEGLRFIEGF